MSRFYGSIQGTKGEATRCGDSKNGIHGHVRGWNLGGMVRMFVNEHGEDVCRIWVTSGSQGGGEHFLGEFTEESLKLLKKVTK